MIGSLALLALTLGYFGFEAQLRREGTTQSFGDVVYLDLQLFVIQIPIFKTPLHPALNVARFLAPSVAGYTAWQAVARLFADQLQSFRLRLIRDHVVICGLGRKGLVLAREFLRRGDSVVIIEQDEENDFVRPCRELGALVLVGDASERELLTRVGVARARCVLALCDDDGVNAQVAVHAADIAGGRDGAPLACVVHVFDPQFCALLRQRELGTAAGTRLRLEFFNVFELGARVLLEEERPGADAPDSGPAAPEHVVIVGVGHMGESLVVAAARQWRARAPSGSRLCVTLVDSHARAIAESLRARYPELDAVSDLTACEMDVRSARFVRAEFLDHIGDDAHLRIFVCLDDDSLGLASALAIARRVDPRRASVVVRMAQDAGLATLLRGLPDESGSFRHLRAFALLDRACRPEQVLHGNREVLARAIHSEYLRLQRAAGDTLATNSSLRPWDDLPDDLKESNREQADDLRSKLDAVGCHMEAVTAWDDPLFEFTPGEIESMAVLEHDRWMRSKVLAGWRHGERKDPERKTHPCLVAYAQLPESEKDKDRNTVRSIPKFLASIGYRVQRVTRKAGSCGS